MTHLLVDDILKLTARAVSSRQVGQVSCHFRVSAVSGSSLTPQEAADKWQALTDGAWPGVLAPTSVGASCLVERLVALSGRVAEYGQGTTTFPVGAVSTGHIPGQVAAVVKKFTGIAGPRHRGRIYVPFVPLTFFDEDASINPTGRAAYGTFTAVVFARPLTLGTAPDTVVLTPIIYHRHPTASTWEDVALFLVSPRFGTQKRRGDYGTPNDVPG